MSTFAHTDTVAVDTGTGKTTSLIKEACIDSLQSALAAQSCGANRVELCADLDFDGLTPSESLVREVFARLSIPIRVMVRPRHDTFVYTAEDVATMKLSILLFKSIGVEGVVLGCLKEDRSLDIELIEELAEVAYPELNVVVHKAIDHTPDPLDALRSILALNRRAERNLIRAVLTSGGNFRRAIEGEAVLRDMQSLIDRTVNGHRAFNGSGCNRNHKVDKKNRNRRHRCQAFITADTHYGDNSQHTDSDSNRVSGGRTGYPKHHRPPEGGHRCDELPRQKSRWESYYINFRATFVLDIGYSL